MFRHKSNKEESKSESQKSAEEKEKSVKKVDKEEILNQVQDDKEKSVEKEDKSSTIKISSTSDNSLHELLEKNLKWSQIIYEQNRKINSKLVWSAVASWLRLFLILIPLILAVFYLPPLLKDLLGQYGSILGMIDPNIDMNSLNGIFDNLPLESSQLEKIKTLLGK